MVAATIRRKTGFSGLRPLDAAHDLAGVATVIAEAFRGEMDPAGERAVREMHRLGRIGPLAWWLDLFTPVGEGFSPGFVWLEDGRIVGNATVRRATAFGSGYVVGNVAVLPDYRGRGIARQLMEACITFARDEGGAWMALEVRADNTPARQLYLNLGFQQTGAVAQLRREASVPIQSRTGMDEWLKPGGRIRRPCSSEGQAIFALARSAMPEGLWWAEPLRESDFSLGWDRRLDLWLSGRGEAWWVAEREGKIVGAIGAEMFRNPHEEGRLRMWSTSGHRPHAALLDAALGMREVALHPMIVSHPAADVEALKVIEGYGFRPLRTLAHMKLNLRR
jgi:GNAT superfamily N-acetyltransferase